MSQAQLETDNDEDWSLVIRPQSNWFDMKFKELWAYRDLLFLFVRRDFVSVYKQTILGPLWFFIQPMLTTVVFTVVFGNIADIPTDGVPPFLFYLSGITAWSYFADCLNKTSSTFTTNAAIFGKVYFPRLIMPISVVSSNLIKFVIQFLLFMAFLIYYLIAENAQVQPNIYVLLMPLLILMMAGLGLGLGMIISSLTTKYRDLTFLVTFGVQLLMYATPVIIPLSEISEKYQWIVLANPMTPIIETFRFSFLGSGTTDPLHLIYSAVFTVVVLFLGVIVFNRVEKSFVDTV